MISWSYHTRKWLHPNNVRYNDYSLESPGSVLYTHQILDQITHYHMLHNAFRCIIFVRLILSIQTGVGPDTAQLPVDAGGAGGS